MDTLTIRIVLSSILFFIFMVGSISLFLQKKNGITKAMALFTLFAGLHVGMVIILGFIDFSKPENADILQIERIVWNWIMVGWIISGLYLGWILIKGNGDE